VIGTTEDRPNPPGSGAHAARHSDWDRSAETIKASGHVPHKQAGHMTASHRSQTAPQKILASKGPSTHDPELTELTPNLPNLRQLSPHCTPYSQKLWSNGSIGTSWPSTSLHTICCSVSMMQFGGNREPRFLGSIREW
jgi:hypothetical protein